VVEGFNVALGGRLRSARRRRGLSLTEVEVRSNQEFKASVLGAYERGERSLSVHRLARLARFYELPVHQLIPPDDQPEEEADTEAPVRTIDLERLTEEGEGAIVDRFLASIHLMRRPEPAGMAVRRSDLAILSSMLEALPAAGPSPAS
jgi:transcriptional regulator with XRE-family HTH domain